jgi:hypothetical protein
MSGSEESFLLKNDALLDSPRRGKVHETEAYVPTPSHAS